MAVFPAASGNFLPDSWRNLMADPVSICVCVRACVCVCACISMCVYLCVVSASVYMKLFALFIRNLPLLIFILKTSALISMGRSMHGKVCCVTGYWHVDVCITCNIMYIHCVEDFNVCLYSARENLYTSYSVFDMLLYINIVIYSVNILCLLINCCKLCTKYY